MWREYLFPESVDQALEWLIRYKGDARIIAGGTDLVLQSKEGKCPSTVMVDITRIPGLSEIEEQDGHIRIGALVTHGEVAASPLIREKGGPLAEACGAVGGPQIRNMATLAGNVVNALPAADGAVALFALNAEAEVASASGRRWEPISDVYEAVGVCSINSCVEMVTALRFRPLNAHHRSGYQRLARRRSLALPIINAAVVVGLREQRFDEARISIGPVAAKPFRAAQAEASLADQEISAEAVANAAALAAAHSTPRNSDVRGSKAYRTAMVEVLVRRALLQAAGLQS